MNYWLQILHAVRCKESCYYLQMSRGVLLKAFLIHFSGSNVINGNPAAVSILQILLLRVCSILKISGHLFVAALT